MRRLLYFTFIMVILSIVSCGRNNSLTKKMDEIKRIGNDNPQKALLMLDSIGVDIRDASEADIMKFDLLKIRLRDKAYIPATSDISIKGVVSYYENNGTEKDKQEAYYYAGSVYRDLQDTPRSLEYFLKSSDLAENSPECDTIMLKNTYSNLCYLFLNVQDYQHAFENADKQYRISKGLGYSDVTCLLQEAICMEALDSTKTASEILNTALNTIISDSLYGDFESMHLLLLHFSWLKDTVNAEKCYSILEHKMRADKSNERFACYNFSRRYFPYAVYHELVGHADSAIFYNQKILLESKDLFTMCDASKAMYNIYKKTGNRDMANKYADIYIQTSDSVNFGKRQKLASTAYNQFQYHLDKNKERIMTEENNRFRLLLTVLCAVGLMILLLAVIYIVYRRNRHLKELLAISTDRNNLIFEKNRLQEDICLRESELTEIKDKLNNQYCELNITKEELARVNAKLASYDDELKEKERQLTKKTKQNQTYINMLHQSELESTAEEIIRTIRKSAKGKKEMSVAEWKQLYKAVDELYPTFKDQLVNGHDTIEEKQMKVCYLLKIGLTNIQIQNITELSRVTIWRWTKKYSWIKDNPE